MASLMDKHFPSDTISSSEVLSEATSLPYTYLPQTSLLSNPDPGGELSLGVAFKCRDLVQVLTGLLLLPQEPDPVVEPPVPGQGHVEECLAVAGDGPG